jgi:hypothetical protein
VLVLVRTPSQNILCVRHLRRHLYYCSTTPYALRSLCSQKRAAANAAAREDPDNTSRPVVRAPPSVGQNQ